MSDQEALQGARDVSVVELLDRLLDKGVVLAGDITIAVADIPLIYLGLRVLLSSAETAERFGAPVPGSAALSASSLGAGISGNALDRDALDADALHGDALSDPNFPPSQPDAGGISPDRKR